jgi:large subunit ribosomal protein L5
MTTTTSEPKSPPRLLTKFKREVFPALRKQFGYANPMQVPRLEKIVINMGIGRATENKARIEHATRELMAICGQKPLVRVARRAIASFKIRENYPVGVAVTLRGARMWEFLDRLISIAIPRIRDFRGVPSKFDGSGNYTLGISEQSIFPEINLDRIEFVQGMHITFVTSARTDQEGLALLKGFGFPFRSQS